MLYRLLFGGTMRDLWVRFVLIVVSIHVIYAIFIYCEGLWESKYDESQLTISELTDYNQKLENIIGDLSDDVTIKRNTIHMLEHTIDQLKKQQSKRVTVTFYCPSAGGINSEGDPNRTASGSRPKPGWTIAVSRNLIEEGFYGTQIDICDVIPRRFRGVHFSGDKMAPKDPKGRPIVDRIDICVGKLSDIPKQGVFRDVLISKIVR